jgi:hypothetical protein
VQIVHWWWYYIETSIDTQLSHPAQLTFVVGLKHNWITGNVVALRSHVLNLHVVTGIGLQIFQLVVGLGRLTHWSIICEKERTNSEGTLPHDTFLFDAERTSVSSAYAENRSLLRRIRNCSSSSFQLCTLISHDRSADVFRRSRKTKSIAQSILTASLPSIFGRLGLIFLWIIYHSILASS